MIMKINQSTANHLKGNLEPCLALIFHVTDTGNQRYMQMVSWDNDLQIWQDLYNLKPLNNGEQILKWTPLKWIEKNYQHWING